MTVEARVTAVKSTARPRSRSVRAGAAIGALCALVPVVLVLGIAVGQVVLSPGDVVDALLRGATGGSATTDTARLADTVVWQLRAPRALLGLCVGAILALSGAALQAVVRNDLADPYLLGITSGASLGAAAVIALGLGALAGTVGTSGGAFLGALLALIIVLALVGPRRRLGSGRLVLAGLAVGYALSAVTNLVVVLSDNRDAIRAITFWMLGSLGQAAWDDLPLVAFALLATLGVLVMWGRRLDAIGLGDDVARGLGSDPDRLRRNVAIVTAVAIAAAVAVSGAIGFVGLVVPHLARGLVGATHRLLLPTSALLGGVLLVAADTLARTVLAPREIPLGILTALLGTPLLLLLIARRTRDA
ncbi:MULTISPECIES: iron ABC transporter permease [Microbacterium]|uniref:FecCD family ABC transporter permease n=1 Tax=Microbacterium TaxID=33882 RepID=UPI00278A7B20|nr:MULTISPECIES: iron ABC transporter permease [Microbacterium]MDQ1082229.1 iron complex transport system permease protein [Microbacterium sp. SORGH_AS_0344]MDQ1169000.1 iron complex transport system permease protein [Microbacterium proteolyticum]